ncbi:MAG: lysophospholipid acyltransferase family protein [Paracoccaceae bacterium]
MRWDGAPEPAPRPLGPAGVARALARGLPLATTVFGGLALLLALRLIERPLHGAHRPWSPGITVAVCRAALRILGLDHRVRGAPMTGPGALVANHASWLDIFALNACGRLYFVAKAEVAGWPGIGWLARATGTVFIRRERAEAARHVATLAGRMGQGHLLAFFPEGTSTDGLRVLAFKPTLFAAFADPAMPEGTRIQPVTLAWRAADAEPASQYGWWGEMGFGPHLLGVLSAPRHGSVEVTFHPPIPATSDRKALAHQAQSAVASALTPAPAPAR